MNAPGLQSPASSEKPEDWHFMAAGFLMNLEAAVPILMGLKRWLFQLRQERAAFKKENKGENSIQQ